MRRAPSLVAWAALLLATVALSARAQAPADRAPDGAPDAASAAASAAPAPALPAPDAAPPARAEKRIALVVGTGGYQPERRLTNADLSEIVDTSDEWITTRTGIKERRIAAI